MGCAVQLLRSHSCRNERRCRLSFLGAPSGSGDWIASELLQLREQGTSPSFDRMSRFVQYRVSACWHRGHLGLRCLHFADDGFCQRFDAVNNLLRIEAAFVGKQLPISPGEVVAPGFARDFLCQVLRDVTASH